jgi:hypothetical protein
MVDGKIVAKKTLDHALFDGAYGSKKLRELGKLHVLPGFQLRYVYFLQPASRPLLRTPELSYSVITQRGAQMYRGESRGQSAENGTAVNQPQGTV